MKVYITYKEHQVDLCNFRCKLIAASLFEPVPFLHTYKEFELEDDTDTVFVVLARYTRYDSDYLENRIPLIKSKGHGYIVGVYSSNDEAQKVANDVRKCSFKTSKDDFLPWEYFIMGSFLGKPKSVNVYSMKIKK